MFTHVVRKFVEIREGPSRISTNFTRESFVTFAEGGNVFTFVCLFVCLSVIERLLKRCGPTFIELGSCYLTSAAWKLLINNEKRMELLGHQLRRLRAVLVAAEIGCIRHADHVTQQGVDHEIDKWPLWVTSAVTGQSPIQHTVHQPFNPHIQGLRTRFSSPSPPKCLHFDVSIVIVITIVIINK